jgi:type IV pilus assembly protein PilO
MTAIGAGVYFITLDQLDLLEIAEQKESTLKIEFEGKQKKAVNLQDYQEQLNQIEVSLDEMIKQMPTEEEVASLIIDISQTGLASGLQFKLFKPEAPVRKDFYSELPINIQVTGQYEELGLFVSGLASLPRIVTLHNVNIIPEGNKNNTSLNFSTGSNIAQEQESLQMTAVVKTYNEGTAVSLEAPETMKRRNQK